MTDQAPSIETREAPDVRQLPAVTGVRRRAGDLANGDVRGSAAAQASVRGQNLALVASLAFAAPEPISRAAIAAASGLTRSTVSRLVDDLVAGGVLRELAPQVSGRGRPATPVVPARGTFVGLGLEIAPTYVGARLVDLAGEVVAERIDEASLGGGADVDEAGGDGVTDAGGAGSTGVHAGEARHRQAGPGESGPRKAGSSAVDASVAALADVTARVLEADGRPDGVLVGCALAVPGLVGPDGVVLRAPNLGWRDIEVAHRLAERLPALRHHVIEVRNEAEWAAVAHALDAPGRPAASRTFFYVSGGVGIGGTSIVDGRPAVGRHGWGGEIGHTTVEPDGPDCACGSRGCLEQYLGREVLERALGMPVTAEPRRLREAVAADGQARSALERAGWALGVALANVVNLLDVDDIVLGGDLIGLVDLLRAPAEAEIARRVLAAPWSTVRIRAGRDDHPALTGAAQDMVSTVIDRPGVWAARG